MPMWSVLVSWWKPLQQPTQLPPQLLDLFLQAAGMIKSVQHLFAQMCEMLLQLVATFRQWAAASNIWRWLHTRDNAKALVDAPVYLAPKPLPNDDGSDGEAVPSSSAMTCFEVMTG